MIDALESALLIQLRSTLRWESSVPTRDASGTLTPINPYEAFNYLDYQARDRELAFRDTINAAAVVNASIDVANVWGYSAPRIAMEGPQQPLLPMNLQDAGNVNGQVRQVLYASIAYDAARNTDRDLYGRDLLIYETLARACQVFAQNSVPLIDASGTIIPAVTAWSLASGTASKSDINSALPMGRDTFRNPDYNLADRDNAVAAYAAQLAQILKNPFLFADRLYVSLTGPSSREAEVYTLIQPYFVAGTLYSPGDQVAYGTAFYQAVNATTDVPGTSGNWTSVTSLTLRVWAAEPRLLNRNRIVYNSTSMTLQWFSETATAVHVPQLYAMSIPGVFSGQTVTTVAEEPVREDAQFWRRKAARVQTPGSVLSDVSVISNTASSAVTGCLVQPAGASFTVPAAATFTFPGGNIAPGAYRVALLVKPDSTVKIIGSQNNQGFTGTNNGAAYGATGTTLNWSVGLPATAWTMQLDYTNLSGTTAGFNVEADLSGATIVNGLAPLYFNDQYGNPLPNGTPVQSTPVPVPANGMPQVLNVGWVGGMGSFQVNFIEFQTYSPAGAYQMSGTLAGAVATLNTTGSDQQTDLMLFDFVTGTSVPPVFSLTLQNAAPLPVIVLQAHIMAWGTTTPTPQAPGVGGFRNECLERAQSSVQDSFYAAVGQFGTNTPNFCAVPGVWAGASTENWMAFIETQEQRLREIHAVPSGALVSGREYAVGTGVVVYSGGTYASGSTFYAGSGTAFTTTTAGTVNQIGAFALSKPGNVGQAALTPAGLQYDMTYGTVMANFDGSNAWPVLATLQPWMVGVGVYAAQSDFWSPLEV